VSLSGPLHAETNGATGIVFETPGATVVGLAFLLIRVLSHPENGGQAERRVLEDRPDLARVESEK
jgi:hypothetical protein